MLTKDWLWRYHISCDAFNSAGRSNGCPSVVQRRIQRSSTWLNSPHWSQQWGKSQFSYNCWLGMRRERFPQHRLQRKPLFSDPGMHHGTCVMHVPWCMSGSLTRGGGENVPGIPGACATRNFTYLVRGPWLRTSLCTADNALRCSANERKYVSGLPKTRVKFCLQPKLAA